MALNRLKPIALKHWEILRWRFMVGSNNNSEKARGLLPSTVIKGYVSRFLIPICLVKMGSILITPLM